MLYTGEGATIACLGKKVATFCPHKESKSAKKSKIATIDPNWATHKDQAIGIRFLFLRE
jgi:hypothetical protein